MVNLSQAITSSREEVLRYFLLSNRDRRPDSGAREEMDALRQRIDGCLTIPLGDWERFEIHAVEYLVAANLRNNPVVVWTIGGVNRHGQKDRRQVSQWVRVKGAPLDAFYSNGAWGEINRRFDEAEIQGNLKAFTLRYAATSEFAPSFRLTDVPRPEMQSLVGVYHASSSRHGTIELIDGLHRAVAMIHQGHTDAPAFLAIS
jgi:hypothetical protein